MDRLEIASKLESQFPGLLCKSGLASDSASENSEAELSVAADAQKGLRSGFFGMPVSDIHHDNCDVHGAFESKNLFGSLWSKCPYCASIDRADKLDAMAKEQAKARFDAWEKRMGESGIPELFMSRTLDSYKADSREQGHALSLARDFADQFDHHPGRCAIFRGETGTGKTHLSCGIGIELMKRHKTVRFITMQKLFRKLKESFGSSTEKESKIIELLAQTDLLILDELGVQMNSLYEQNILTDIMNERYERSRSTIFLSNLELTDIKSIIGDRVMRRMREKNSIYIELDWGAYAG